MNLVEKWRTRARQFGETSPTANTYGLCAFDLEDACTPQPPKAEWFGAPFDGDGKPTGKWDAWWFREFGICRRSQLNGEWLHAYWGAGVEGASGSEYFPVKLRDGLMCIPIAREGFPAPVSWAVVGG